MPVFAVVSDLHIKPESYGAVRALKEAVLAEDIDGLLCSGDVFDRHDSSEQALELAVEFFAACAEKGLPSVSIGGNHDAESELTERLSLPEHAHWLGTEKPGTVLLEALGVAVHGQSVRDRDELRNLAAGYPQPVPGLINIGLLHTSLTGELSKRACAPATVPQLESMGYDAWMLGHVHQQLLLCEHPLIAYPGSAHAQPIKSQRNREGDAHGYALLSCAPAGNEVPGAASGAPGVRNEVLDEGSGAGPAVTDVVMEFRTVKVPAVP